MITVYECGNGDCFLIEDDIFNLQIDLGKSINPHLKINNVSIDYDLMISHSHDDHIIGNVGKLNKAPNEIFVPAYYPEYLCIKNKLEGGNNTLLKGMKYSLLYEGKMLYGKYEILNPSLTPWIEWKIGNIPDINESELDEYLREKNTSYREIINEVESVGRSYERPREESFNPKKFVDSYFKLLLKNKYPDLDDEDLDVNMLADLPNGQSRAGRLNFFVKYFDRYQANDMSIVFLYENDDKKSVLFTGDAGKMVWDRLIDKGKSIKCDVLKTPHHGSKHNLNLKILNEMKPEIALISHNNQHGKIDHHPNIEILGYLKFFKVDVHCTNDIVKNSITWKNKTSGLIPSYNIKFV